jgi:hypothetical protein
MKAYLINVFDVITMPFQDIDCLAYEDDQGNMVTLPSSYQYIIWIIKHCYNSYCTLEGNPIDDDWKTIVAEQYNEYCLSPAYAATTLPSPPLVTSGVSPSSPHQAHDAISEFKKGIKHDSGSFSIY